MSDFEAQHEALLELQEELRKLKTGVSTIEAFSDTTRQLLKNVNGVKTENQATAKELQASLQIFEQATSSVQAKTSELLQAIEANLANLQQILSSLDEVKLPETFESIEQKLSALSGDYDQLKRETQEGQAHTRGQIENQSTRIVALDTEIQQLRQTVTQIRSTIEATVDKIGTQLRPLESIANDTSQKLGTLSIEFEEVRQQQTEFKTALKWQHQKLKAFDDHLSEVNRELRKFRSFFGYSLLILGAITVLAIAIAVLVLRMSTVY